MDSNLSGSTNLLAIVLADLLFLVMGVLFLYGTDTTGMFWKTQFIAVEGTATNLQEHQVSGRSLSKFISFRLNGGHDEYWSDAINGIHPSWHTNPPVIRAYIPEDSNQKRIKAYGVKTYGLWIDHKEYMSLEHAVQLSAQNSWLLLALAIVCFVAGIYLSFYLAKQVMRFSSWP